MAEEQKQERKRRVKTVDCAQCSKQLKHRLWYYRSGQYFCNRRCWGVLKKKLQEEQAA